MWALDCTGKRVMRIWGRKGADGPSALEMFGVWMQIGEYCHRTVGKKNAKATSKTILNIFFWRGQLSAPICIAYLREECSMFRLCSRSLFIQSWYWTSQPEMLFKMVSHVSYDANSSAVKRRAFWRRMSHLYHFCIPGNLRVIIAGSIMCLRLSTVQKDLTVT